MRVGVVPWEDLRAMTSPSRGASRVGPHLLYIILVVFLAGLVARNLVHLRSSCSVAMAPIGPFGADIHGSRNKDLVWFEI